MRLPGLRRSSSSSCAVEPATNEPHTTIIPSPADGAGTRCVAPVPVSTAANAGAQRTIAARPCSSATRSPMAMVRRSALVSASGTTTAGARRRAAWTIALATSSAPLGRRMWSSGTVTASAEANRPPLRSSAHSESLELE